MTLNLEHLPLHSITKCIWFAAVECTVLVLHFFAPYATLDSVTGRLFNGDRRAFSES